jgi:hypothetical protein
MPVLDARNSAFNDLFCALWLQHLTYQPSPHSQHKWLLLSRVPFASAEHRSPEWLLPRSGRGRSRRPHRQARDGLSMRPAQGDSDLGISRSASGTPCLANATEWPRGTGTLFVPARSRVAFLLLTFSLATQRKVSRPKGEIEPSGKNPNKPKAKLDSGLRRNDRKNQITHYARPSGRRFASFNALRAFVPPARG